MSRHNISGSEVFGPKPGVMVRTVRTSGLRRQRAALTGAAFIAGAIILNVLKEELPEERQSRFIPFILGVVLYGALLLLL